MVLALLLGTANANTVGGWYTSFPVMDGTKPNFTGMNDITGALTGANFYSGSAF